MSPIRILGSVLSLLNGAWAVYIHYNGLTAQPISIPTIWAAVVGGVLVVDALVSLAGVRMGFALGVVLSAVVLGLVALQWNGYVAADAEVAIVLSAVCVVLDAIALRPSRGLSEKDSPLNLPVFG